MAGLLALSVATYLVGLALLICLPIKILDGHRMWIIPVFALVGAFLLVGEFTRRVILTPDSIRLVSISAFLLRTIPRAEIESVTWEKGGDVHLKLRDGKWVRLPGVGRNIQGVANTVRAWLEKTETPK